jgi:hypothetical protein
LVERAENLSGDVLVELEGELSPDRDLDAHAAAILGAAADAHSPTARRLRSHPIDS